MEDIEMTFRNDFLEKLLKSSPYNPTPPKAVVARYSAELHSAFMTEFETLLNAVRAENTELVLEWCGVRVESLARNELINAAERHTILELLSSMLTLKDSSLSYDAHAKFAEKIKQIEQGEHASDVGAIIAGIARSSIDKNLGVPPVPPGSRGAPASTMGARLGADVAGAIGVASIGRLAIFLSPWGYAAAIGLGAALCSAAVAL